MMQYSLGMIEREGKGREMEHRLPYARIKQTDIRGQLGGRSHSASQVIAHLLLVDYDRSGEMFYLIHIRSR